MAKEHSLPYYLPIAENRISGCIFSQGYEYFLESKQIVQDLKSAQCVHFLSR